MSTQDQRIPIARAPAILSSRRSEFTVARAAATTTTAARVLAVLRIALGFVFFWAFLDKVFGLGYTTPAAAAWIHGGSPTKAFLSDVHVGPFAGVLRSWAGAGWADWLFMLGLAGVGLALLLGIGLRAAAVAGTALVTLMWLAEWPLAKVAETGQPTGSANPIVDFHVIYVLVLIALAVTAAGEVWGLGRWWSRLVGQRRWLV